MDGRIQIPRFFTTRRRFLIAVGGVVIANLSSPSQGEWVDRREAGPFEIRSEFALTDESGKALVKEISRLRHDVETMLNIKASDDPIEVNLFKGKSSYQAFLKQRVPEGAERPALFVKGADRSRVYVYRRNGFETDVRHESTHAVLHNALPFVPMWLDEGLAEYFEVPPADRPSKNPHHKSLQRSLWFGWRPDLGNLEQRTELSTFGGDQYRESWAWVHFLLHGSTGPRQILADYLYDIRQGNQAGKLSSRLAEKDPDYGAALVRHFKTWKS